MYKVIFEVIIDAKDESEAEMIARRKVGKERENICLKGWFES